MRVLITGAGGQLGHDLVEAFGAPPRPRLPVEVVGADRARLDVADRDAVLQAMAAVHPDIVIHAGAWTAVDACEDDPDRAWLVNALGTRHVAEGARHVGAHLCYLSTDYVFSGDASRPYTEWDRPCPRSVYGRSKLGGERELGPEATVVRTAWLSGRHGHNIVKTLLRLAGGTGPLRFVNDQRGSPTTSADVAAAIRLLAVERRPGLFHITNSGETTWYGLARAVMQLTGGDPGRVEPIATSALDQARRAPRPAYSVLDNAAWRLSGLAPLPAWEESLGRLVRALQA